MTIWIVLAGLLLVYLTTTTVLLLSAKFKKNEKGNLILNPESWHFRLSHPFITRAYSSDFIIENSGGFILPSNICLYSATFSIMLYLVWPLLIFWSVFRTVLYFPFMILFGYYPIADIESMRYCGFPFAVGFGKIPLPKIYGHRIFPASFVLPVVLFGTYHYYPDITFEVGRWILLFVIFTALVIGSILGANWLKKTDQEEISLARVWLSAKKDRICWRLELPPVSK